MIQRQPTRWAEDGHDTVVQGFAVSLQHYQKYLLLPYMEVKVCIR